MSIIVLALVVGLVHADSSSLFGGVNYRIGCLGPKKVPGFCVSYENCPGIKDVIPKHDPKYILQALSEHTCGFKEGAVYVCCPRSSQRKIITTTLRTTTEEMFGMESRETIVATTVDTVDFAQKWETRQKPSFYAKCICPARNTVAAEHKNARLLPKDCGIMAGSGFQLEDHPWTVLLRLRLDTGQTHFTCVGSLISPRYVLSAAHCVKNELFPKNSVIDLVRVGEFDQALEVDCVGWRCSTPPKDIQVEETIVHDGYKIDSQDNDIALIRLKTQVEINKFVRPICVPRDAFEDSKDFWTVGWGYGLGHHSNKSVKSKVKLSIVPVKDCALIYKNLKLTDGKICAGIENDDESCQSGSPLMAQNLVNSQIRWFIEGVFSLTPTACGTPDKPSIFTRVSKYRNWILDNMRE